MKKKYIILVLIVILLFSGFFLAVLLPLLIPKSIGTTFELTVTFDTCIFGDNYPAKGIAYGIYDTNSNYYGTGITNDEGKMYFYPLDILEEGVYYKIDVAFGGISHWTNFNDGSFDQSESLVLTAGEIQGTFKWTHDESLVISKPVDLLFYNEDSGLWEVVATQITTASGLATFSGISMGEWSFNVDNRTITVYHQAPVWPLVDVFFIVPTMLLISSLLGVIFTFSRKEPKNLTTNFLEKKY